MAKTKLTVEQVVEAVREMSRTSPGCRAYVVDVAAKLGSTSQMVAKLARTSPLLEEVDRVFGSLVSFQPVLPTTES